MDELIVVLIKDLTPLTDDEIVAQSVLFFAAGHETTG